MSQQNILYWNCANGIFNKRDIIKNYLQINSPELFFISESEIDKTKELNLLETLPYELNLSNTLSDTRKARICCYSKPEWTLLPNSSTMDEILSYKKQNHIIIGIYRPFKTYSGESTTTNFERLLANLQQIIDSNPNHNITIVGDFNVDYNKMGDRTYQRFNLASTLQDFQISNGLIQMVKEITRHRMIKKMAKKHFKHQY